MKKQIVVTNASAIPRPCAGTIFKGTEAFAADHFTAEQLKAIAADRLLTVVIGEILTADEVDGFLASAEPKAAKAKG
jgi:hypothetical protein